jgi:hypothetical protein
MDKCTLSKIQGTNHEVSKKANSSNPNIQSVARRDQPGVTKQVFRYENQSKFIA